MKTTPSAVLFRLVSGSWRQGIWACVALAAGWLASPASARIVAGYYPEWRRWSYPPLSARITPAWAGKSG